MKPANNMINIKQLFKTEVPNLMPFFISVIIYFVYVRNPYGELWTTLLKCAPIFCLILYILLNGFNLTSDYKYMRLIVVGLVFSCGGDVLLNIDLFPYGMGLFAFAQISYTVAFGYKTINWSIAMPLYLAGAIFVVMIFNQLDEVLSIGVPIYVTLLLTMSSCSLSRAVKNKGFFNYFCALGSVSFVISDGFIGVDMFLVRVPNARIWIMSTYYLAQFAIALSVANEATTKKSSKYITGHSNSARSQ